MGTGSLSRVRACAKAYALYLRNDPLSLPPTILLSQVTWGRGGGRGVGTKCTEQRTHFHPVGTWSGCSWEAGDKQQTREEVHSRMPKRKKCPGGVRCRLKQGCLVGRPNQHLEAVQTSSDCSSGKECEVSVEAKGGKTQEGRSGTGGLWACSLSEHRASGDF